jgi:hypothetical protein
MVSALDTFLRGRGSHIPGHGSNSGVCVEFCDKKCKVSQDHVNSITARLESSYFFVWVPTAANVPVVQSLGYVCKTKRNMDIDFDTAFLFTYSRSSKSQARRWQCCHVATSHDGKSPLPKVP